MIDALTLFESRSDPVVLQDLLFLPLFILFKMF